MTNLNAGSLATGTIAVARLPLTGVTAGTYANASVTVDAQGRKIDFRLTEECLLKISLEGPSGTTEVHLATRDTPESLKKAIEEDKAHRNARQAEGDTASASEERGGLFSSLRRILGGG